MSDQEPEKEYDIYRDSLLRYCGYANEVGEAFRAQTAHMTYKGFNGPVSLTYAIATAYCAADALDKGIVIAKVLFLFEFIFTRFFFLGKKTGKVMGALDAFAWQIAASVAIPGFTIHQICHYSGKGIQTVFPKIPKGPRYV